MDEPAKQCFYCGKQIKRGEEESFLSLCYPVILYHHHECTPETVRKDWPNERECDRCDRIIQRALNGL
jgi:hypothetical protein